MKHGLSVLVAIAAAAAQAQIGALAQSKADKVKVQPAFELKARPFALERVRLLDGPFKTAQDADHKYLLTLDPHRLLNGFYRNAGLETKGEAYGGWERMDIAGHSLGHYLSGASMMYAATGDAKLREKVETIVRELKRCQDASNDGMIAGFPDAQRVWDEIAKGEVRSQPFNLNGIWVPWYNQHKLLAGLFDAYLYCDSDDALAVAARLGDWAIAVTKDLTPELWQRMLATEHGGMNEVLADLYGFTGEKKYLDLAMKFHHERVLGPLERGERRLTGLHGNTQVPKAIGAAREYELSGEARFANIAKNFWHEVVEDHTYVSGGNTMGEYFGPPKQLSARIGSNTTETCNTYNMLKLTQRLMCWEPSVALGDYYEKALWNHILASVNPSEYGVTYFLPLGMGVQKRFSGPTNDFTCCHGSGMENHAKYGGAVFYEDGDTLYIDQFISSELDWKEKGVKVRLEAPDFPRGSVVLRLEMKEPKSFTIRIRTPGWIEGGLRANSLEYFVFHMSYGSARPGEYLDVKPLTQKWNTGDEIHLGGMANRMTSVPMPDNDKRTAYMLGPILMAGVWDSRTTESGLLPSIVLSENPAFAPVVIRNPSTAWYKSEFDTIRPSDLQIVPLYTVRDERYSVFFDTVSMSDWFARLKAHEVEQERLRELESRTVEFVDVGSQRAVRENGLKSEKSFAGTLNEKRWRDARDGGWFEFEIAVDPEMQNQLMLTYWGSDGGNRHFDVIVDGTTVATQRLDSNKPGEFFDVAHDLPLELTEGKQKVTVRIQAKPGAMAGGVFGVRTVRPAK